jgi:hypothetical protein
VREGWLNLQQLCRLLYSVGGRPLGNVTSHVKVRATCHWIIRDVWGPLSDDLASTIIIIIIIINDNDNFLSESWSRFGVFPSWASGLCYLSYGRTSIFHLDRTSTFLCNIGYTAQWHGVKKKTPRNRISINIWASWGLAIVNGDWKSLYGTSNEKSESECHYENHSIDQKSHICVSFPERRKETSDAHKKKLSTETKDIPLRATNATRF